MSELDEQIRNRRAKRDALVAQGIDPYPRRFEWDAEPAGVHARWGGEDAAILEAATVRLRVPGRVRAIRAHGKTTFLDLHDGREKLQVLVRKDRLPEPARLVLENLDLGDQLGAAGTLMRTRMGELTLAADDLTLLAKALRPPPEKWHGLADVEQRYRQRYLDLVANPESRRVFEVRAALVKGIREFLDARGFLEVETPMMHVIPGGATARPFQTHHNTLDLDLYLRIAPELFLKRLLVGGIPRVYEINRNFRNEGISTRHNPEFTMLEFYWAYADYRDMMDLTEELIAGIGQRAKKILGREELTWQGESLSLDRPWARYTMKEAIAKFAGVPAERLEHVVDLAGELKSREIPLPMHVIGEQGGHPALHTASSALYDDSVPVPEGWYGHFLVQLFEATVEQKLFQPTFITDHPVEISPLAKQRPDDPRFTERFELYMAGMEIANAFSELNDPDVQAERFHQQVAAREHGDAEAHLYDADYVRALEFAMPPAAGNGIGIDRLTMLMTDRQSIRDVILFPLLRPEAEQPSAERSDVEQPSAE